MHGQVGLGQAHGHWLRVIQEERRRYQGHECNEQVADPRRHNFSESVYLQARKLTEQGGPDPDCAEHEAGLR